MEIKTLCFRSMQIYNYVLYYNYCLASESQKYLKVYIVILVILKFNFHKIVVRH